METFQPKSILCPTDFSEPATLALHYGKHLADCFDARLIVLYADPFSPPPYFISGQLGDLTTQLERSKGAAREYLTHYVSEHIGGSGKVEMVVAENQTVPAILLMAEEKKIDMIVMGTHGRSGVNRFMLGSVTERVLHETDRPVLTVRGKKVQQNLLESLSSRCYVRLTTGRLLSRLLNTPLGFPNVSGLNY